MKKKEIMKLFATLLVGVMIATTIPAQSFAVENNQDQEELADEDPEEDPDVSPEENPDEDPEENPDVSPEETPEEEPEEDPAEDPTPAAEPPRENPGGVVVDKDSSGGVKIKYSGTTTNEWDYNFGKEIYISYVDAQGNGRNEKLIITCWDGGSVKDGWYGSTSGTTVKVENHANGGTPGPYYVEAYIPSDFFAGGDFKLLIDGEELYISNGSGAADKPADDFEEDGYQWAYDPNSTYEAISIDGDFSDWSAVQRHDGGDQITQAAMVFDGDVYLLLVEEDGGDATNAGSHGNGKYSIVTDLGRQLVLELRGNGITGVPGATVNHVGRYWEICIPKEALPAYTNTISFGLYMEEPFVSEVGNLQSDGEGNQPTADIAFDGVYGDWANYPHTLIQYATAGTQEQVPDGEAALYSNGDKVYGHVVTQMPAHLQEAGGEFTGAMTVLFNEDWGTAFYPRIIAVDGNGNINWNPQVSGLPNGTYEFYIASTDAWGASSNINDLVNGADRMYGKMMVTVRDGQDDMEYYLDLQALAEKFGCDPTDFKTIQSQHGRIGQQWVTTAGTSTGPLLGILLCLSIVAFAYYRKNDKKRIWA